ncbi:nucleotidyltransferase domain-containing protein [Pampinifervens florentissimum]|uniref:nucleotidyltransferase domain-containing protein n=1 Tax=Pampinifervens florentissimum TaxID=1632019 RepID=UPI0013B47E4F|nr:nucleotidyltransferase domain-containing protein [Hydrogenobacter sp. T-8]QID32725.1 nucleotidyltransferase domain-containing protein [Hydrogenobacter sp. T-8]
MRLTEEEKRALKKALEGFEGEVYIFGSRLREDLKGGDIDILLVPKNPENPVELALRVQTKFLLECDQSIDVLVYRDTEFYREVLKNAKRISLEEL